MSNLVLRKEMPFRDSDSEEPFVDVVYAINSLPGIIDITTNIYSLKESEDEYSKLRIHFKVDPSEPQGLFFLTRCVDRRYWEHGYKWEITLSVGDVVEDGILPIHYMLQSGLANRKNIVSECKSLFENMNEHIYHNAFMTGFKIDMSKFNLVDKTAAKRNIKLNEIGI